MKTITVIIVNWNTKNYLRNCLNSIYKTEIARIRETIVVDNASKDGSVEMVMKDFPKVSLIRSKQNLGFARANNLAMQRASGDIFALINSDVIVHPGCIEKLSLFFDQNENVGMVGPKVFGGDGQLQLTCRRLPHVWNTLCRTLALDRIFPFWSLFSGYEVPREKHDRFLEVEVLSGCFCAVRKKAVDQVGGLDAQFFFYGEDIDWCKRFREAGWKLKYVPEATSTHFGGVSTAKAPLKFSIEILRATLKYWKKHHGLIGLIACYILIVAHHGLRLMIRCVKTIVDYKNTVDNRRKIKEDFVCLRWLLRGKEV